MAPEDAIKGRSFIDQITRFWVNVLSLRCKSNFYSDKKNIKKDKKIEFQAEAFNSWNIE